MSGDKFAIKSEGAIVIHSLMLEKGNLVIFNVELGSLSLLPQPATIKSLWDGIRSFSKPLKHAGMIHSLKIIFVSISITAMSFWYRSLGP